MLKDFIKGFIFMFIILMFYLIFINIALIFSAESLGLFENIFLFIILAVFLNIAPFIILFVLDKRKKRKLLEETDAFMKFGTRSEARVMDIRDTGITINDDPVVKITLDVNFNTSGSFQNITELAVSRINIPRIGDVVRIIYDPKNTSRVVIINE